MNAEMIDNQSSSLYNDKEDKEDNMKRELRASLLNGGGTDSEYLSGQSQFGLLGSEHGNMAYYQQRVVNGSL